MSFTTHRLVAYCGIVGWAAISGMPGKALVELAPQNITEILFKIYETINIFPLSLDWTPNYSFGYTVQKYHIAHLVFITLMLFSILLFYLLLKNKKRFYLSVIVLLIPLQILCLDSYFSSNSKVIMQNTYSTDRDALYSDYNYYFDCEQLSKDVDFYVTKYSAEFMINDDLYAEVGMELSNNSLTKYEFTLYHGYKVIGIYDYEGNQLKYEQNGDYVTITPENIKLNKVIVKYKGYAPRYYSNSQGVCLPGFFPYYPKAGFFKVFDVEKQSFCAEPSNVKSIYNFKITGTKLPTFSNLQSSGENFSGYCTDVSIVSGFYDMTEYGGIKIVYPYLDPMKSNIGLIQNSINQIIQNNTELLYDVSTIIIIPSLNQISESEQFCLLNDHWTVKEIFMLNDTLERITVAKEKKILYDIVRLYESNPQNISDLLTVLQYESEEYSVVALFNQIINSKNPEDVLFQCKNFLGNISDTRSAYDFLSSLLN